MSERYIIDGNNLVYAFRDRTRQGGGFNFERMRRELTKRLYRFAAESGSHVTLVYDGTVGGHEDEFRAPDFHALYSTALSSADHIIEEHLAASPDRRHTTVVSSDGAIQTAARAAEALVMSCRTFITQLEASGTQVTDAMHHNARRTPRPTLGDAFP